MALADQIKAEAGGKCVRCGHVDSRVEGYMLTVHHIDLNKSNCRWWNLVALCQRCHLSIQARVIIERSYMFPHSDWFKPYVAGYYAHQLGLPDAREFVLPVVDVLIKIGQGYASADSLPNSRISPSTAHVRRPAAMLVTVRSAAATDSGLAL